MSGRARQKRQQRGRLRPVAFVCAFLIAGTGVAYATHMGANPIGFTTLQKVVEGPDPDSGFAALGVTDIMDTSHLVRDGVSESNPAIPTAKAGRETRRTSLSYFGQLTDFQLADEESPAQGRVPRPRRQLGLAAPGGPHAVHHRLVDPPDEPLRRTPARSRRATAAARRWTSR